MQNENTAQGLEDRLGWQEGDNIAGEGQGCGTPTWLTLSLFLVLVE